MTIADFVLEYFASRGGLPGDTREEKLQVNYIDTGIIDSMGIVLLVGEFEDHFGIRFGAEDLQSDEFLTISGLVAIVARLQAAQRTPAE